MVSPILKSPVNGEYSFVIMGDCFKDGAIFDDFMLHRKIWAIQELHKMQNIVIVNFGEEDTEAFCEEISRCY